MHLSFNSLSHMDAITEIHHHKSRKCLDNRPGIANIFMLHGYHILHKETWLKLQIWHVYCHVEIVICKHSPDERNTPPHPDQSVYHIRTHVWKTPPFRGFWYKIKCPFYESEINFIKPFFLRTSHFSLCLIWNEHLDTRPRSTAWKTQDENRQIHAKYLPFFKISPI